MQQHREPTRQQAGVAGGASLRELRTAQSKLVYLYLDHGGPATVEELRDGLGLTLLSLYSVLDHLREAGLVERRDGKYVAD